VAPLKRPNDFCYRLGGGVSTLTKAWPH